MTVKLRFGVLKARFGADFTPQLQFLVLALLPLFTTLQWFYYDVGDQENYLAYYLNAATASPFSAYLGQRTLTGSAEPGYFFVSYAAAKLGVPYSVYKVAISLALAASTAVLLSRLRVAILSIALFVTFNFYWLALYAELERLAIAMVFLQLGTLRWLDSRRKTSLVFLIASFFSHFQIGILLASAMVGVSAKYLFSARTRFGRWVPRLGVLAILMSVFLLLVAVNLGIAGDIIAVLSSKLAHHRDLDIRNLLQAAVAFPFLCYLSRGRVDFVFSYLFVTLFVLVVGGERLNIFLIFLILFAGFCFRRAKDPVLLIVLTYLLLKGFGFLLNIAETGRGY